MKPPRPMTAVIVPTVGPAPRLERCLGSIAAQTLPFARVLVVGDGGPESLEGELNRGRDVEVLRLPRRLGFAGAVNAGIREVLGDPGVWAVALVNDDVRLAEGWHRAASEALASGRDIGACATVVLQARDPRRLDSAGIEWLSGAVADNRGHGDPPPGIDAPVEDVWGAPASAALFRRSLFDRIGLFDESFTAYQEDVEHALRARLFGLRCVLAPAARAEHDGFGSNRPLPRRRYLGRFLQCPEPDQPVADHPAGQNLAKRVASHHHRSFVAGVARRARGTDGGGLVWCGARPVEDSVEPSAPPENHARG